MRNTFDQIDQNRERKAVSSIFLLMGIFLLMLVLGNIVGAFVLFAFPDFSLSDGFNLIGYFKESKNGWWALMLMQGISSVIIFLGTFWVYWIMIEKKQFKDLNFKPFPKLSVFIFVLMLQIISAPFVSYLGEINSRLSLPESMKGLETTLKNMETQAEQLTELMTSFTGFFQFVLAFTVIALIAGLGEELVFRGLLMRKLFLINFNPHFAIWLSAIIFSAVHFQFYGFLPRVFLGVFFGYVYYWCGNIYLSIFSHIFNNGVIVFLHYLINLKLVDNSVENIEKMPLLPSVLSFVFFMFGFYILRRYLTSNEIGHKLNL